MSNEMEGISNSLRNSFGYPVTDRRRRIEWTEELFNAAIGFALKGQSLTTQVIVRLTARWFFRYIKRNPNWWQDIEKYQREDG